MHTAKLIGIAPQLVVTDVTKTAEYYRDKLGFNIIGYLGDDPPVYAMVERDGMQVHFGKSDNGETRPNTQLRRISVDIIIWVPEIDSFYEELKTRNVEVSEAIVQRSYGREFLITDCNGFTIAVCD